MDKTFLNYWKKLKAAIYLELSLNIVLKTTATILLMLALLGGFSLSIPLEFIILMICLTGLSFTIYSPIIGFNRESLIKKLHLEFDSLEYSLQLFFISDLSPVGLVQKEKIIAYLPAYKQLDKYHNWRVDSVFLISALLSFLILSNSPLVKRANESTAISQSDGIDAQSILTEDSIPVLKIGELIVKVDPPSYTGLKSYNLNDNNEQVVEGSQVSFSSFKGNTEDFIILNAIDTISLNEKPWTLRQVDRAFSFQALRRFQDTVMLDSVSIISIKRDQDPQIAIPLKENRINRSWDEMDDFILPMRLSDDYGINQANMVATLSKGEGESVKFRELKWPLKALRKGTRYQSITYELKIDTLSMGPGDELYFYVELIDNKWPEGQRTKSDVYFLTIEDTTSRQSTNYEGLALSVEAEYFKSQRQIIIDTENLLNERKNMSAKDFKSKSNLIGDDQKILRLRYGVFLGEEFSTTGGLGEIDHSGHDHGVEATASTKKESQHDGHDHEEQAASEGNFSNDIYNTAEMAAYVHAHDDSEIATFFDSKTKQLLKEALANMWEAELYLRTYKPQKAVPYEYKALKLIKEVQQASRIYVERIGFEPPPLEPLKKRLTGELSEIDPLSTDQNQMVYEDYEQILLNIYEELNRNVTVRLNEYMPIMNRLGQTLAKEIDRNPLVYGKLLSYIARFNERPSIKLYEEINYMLAQVLPKIKTTTKSVEDASLKLNEMFYKTSIN